jgi:hypothetical protein
MQNWSQTLTNKFSYAPIIVALISSFNAAVDPAASIAAFLRYIWNVRTAVGYGLNVWGAIVGVSRVIATPSGPITLGDADYQTLILAKAAANIGNVAVPALNRLLQAIFAGSGLAYVQDNLDMTLTYVFLFQPTATQLAIIEYSGALPRPAGVLIAGYVYQNELGPLNTVMLNTVPLNWPAAPAYPTPSPELLTGSGAPLLTGSGAPILTG